MCGSRKYPRPHHRGSLEISRGRGVLKAKIFKGKYDFQRGGGSNQKTTSVGRVWIFLEQHNEPKFLYPKKVPSS